MYKEEYYDYSGKEGKWFKDELKNGSSSFDNFELTGRLLSDEQESIREVI